MKNNFKWLMLFSFCFLVGFISFSVPVYASSVSGDLASGYLIEYGFDDTGEMLRFKTNVTDSTIRGLTYSVSLDSMPNTYNGSTLNFNNASGDLVVYAQKKTNTSGTTTNRLYFGFTNETNHISWATVASGGTGKLYIKFNPTYLVEPPPLAVISPTPSDILNFNWSGSGIKIYNYKDGDKISGYIDSAYSTMLVAPMRSYDVEVYGKFIFPSITGYVNRYTAKLAIQNSLCCTAGANTNKGTIGVDAINIKSFDWLSTDFSEGKEVRFRMVCKMLLPPKGICDLTLGTTINNAGTYTYYSDTVKNVEFLNDNSTYGSIPNESGTTGEVGNTPGNATTPTYQPNGTGDTVNISSSFNKLIQIFSSFSGFIGALFGFLPSEIKILFMTVCTILVGLMIKRAIL